MPQARINGFNMHYTDHGTGTAIVFIHPPVLTSLSFQHQIEALSARFRTIAFDIRGHGRSEASKEAVTYSLIAEDIKGLMDELKVEQAYLCGYSTGGSIVLEFLLAYPERAAGGIVIGGMSEVRDRKLKNAISLGRLFAKFGAVGTIALAVSCGQSRKLSVIRSLYGDAKKGNAKNVQQYYRCSLHYNCTERLTTIPHPVLLVYGEKDKRFRPYAELLHRRLPDSRLIFVKNVTHQIPTKAPERLNESIQRFIERRDPT
ncbi:alpha/beta fold hydrolase [Cohnella sp.]|uniref:alpha/beta fold hydrolase n=1 Tax=Cohnella sp. TaxID=1883426 RepID=UPI00356418B0